MTEWSQRVAEILRRSVFSIDGEEIDMRSWENMEEKQKYRMIQEAKDWRDKMQWKGNVDVVVRLLQEKGLPGTSKTDEEASLHNPGSSTQLLLGSMSAISNTAMTGAMKCALIKGCDQSADDFERLIDEGAVSGLRGYEVYLLENVSVHEPQLVSPGLWIEPKDGVRAILDPHGIYSRSHEFELDMWESAASALIREMTWGPAFGSGEEAPMIRYEWKQDVKETAKWMTITLNQEVRIMEKYVVSEPWIQDVTFAPDWPFPQSVDNRRWQREEELPSTVDAERIVEAWRWFWDTSDTSKSLADNVQLAAQRLENAASRTGRLANQDKVIDVSIALESLYEVPQGSEITEKLSTRVAWFMAESGSVEERVEIKRKVKEFYKLRSSVIHGTYKEVGGEVLEWIFEIARRTLKRRIDEGGGGEEYWQQLTLGRH